jgi:hypothetical protein
MKGWRLLLSTLAVLAAAWLAACGSDSPTSTDGGATSSPATQTTPAAKGENKKEGGGTGARSDEESAGGKKKRQEAGFTPPTHHDSGGGSAQFRTKGGDNSIQEFGGEASSSEFEQAAATLHAFLDARAARAWQAACGYLASSVGEQLEQQFGEESGGGPKGCAGILSALTAGVSSRSLREAAVADVAALRAEGNQGFLLFEGVRGATYFMPMNREDGRWRVAAIAASALP